MRPDARRIEKMFDRLWPICRSITGPGYRQSLDILSEIVPFERLRFQTGERVLDWTVPEEWEARDAYLVGPNGRRYAEFKKNNLHLVNFSEAYRGKMSLAQLKPHLYSLPKQPDAIPYLTSYYKRRWGFCLTDRELQSLPEGEYEVVVDTDIRGGHLEIGEAVLPGTSKREILFSSYLCHPSLANNELSGPLALTFLYERLSRIPNRRFTYRFAVMPETIGAVCYLTRRGEHFLQHLHAGYVITCVGDKGTFTYKKSRRGDAVCDMAALAFLKQHPEARILDYTPASGSDERQYGSPGYNLPVGSLMRTMYSVYPEYHTSLDNKSMMDFDNLLGTVDAYEAIARIIEETRVWKNTVMCGEPRLGPRGLYPTLGSQKEMEQKIHAYLWIMNQSDGSRDLSAVAARSGLDPRVLANSAADLVKAGLLEEVI